MEIYKGKISGTGKDILRTNEITADDLAVIRHYIIGWDYGVCELIGYEFPLTVEGNNVIIGKGLLYAYGYFGYLPESITIPFIRTSATQYRFIYAEIDRSVVPNRFSIKVKNNQGSKKVLPTTFRTDYLSLIKTGVFQFPLYQVELNSEGIDNILDLRYTDLGKGYINRKFLKNVYQSQKVSTFVTEQIDGGAIATTQPTNDNSEKLATLDFVHKAMQKEIGGQTKYLIKFVVQNETSEQITVSPSPLLFDKESGLLKKTFTVECPLTVSVSFSYPESVSVNLLEDEISVVSTGNVKKIIVPIEVDTLDFAGIVEDIIYIKIT